MVKMKNNDKNSALERVASFSIKPTDAKAVKTFDIVKKYSTKTGISFSHLVVQALHLLVTHLKLDQNDNR